MTSCALNSLTSEKLVRLFAETADRLGAAVMNGEVGDGEIKKVYAVEDALRSRGRSARLSLVPLLDHKSRFVRYYAAQALLALVPERSRQIIEENSKQHDAIAGDAGMLLDALDDGSYEPT